MMRAGLEPTSSDYEPDKLPVTLSHQIHYASEEKDSNL